MQVRFLSYGSLARGWRLSSARGQCLLAVSASALSGVLFSLDIVGLGFLWLQRSVLLRSWAVDVDLFRECRYLAVPYC